MQNVSSTEKAKQVAEHFTKLSHYPTLFFFNIDTKRIEWEIFGAEILVDVDASTNEVTFITNEVWYQASKKDVEGYNKPDSSSKYLDYKNLINVIHWGMAPGAAEVIFASRREKAPSYEVKNSYVINY